MTIRQEQSITAAAAFTALFLLAMAWLTAGCATVEKGLAAVPKATKAIENAVVPPWHTQCMVLKKNGDVAGLATCQRVGLKLRDILNSADRAADAGLTLVLLGRADDAKQMLAKAQQFVSEALALVKELGVLK